MESIHVIGRVPLAVAVAITLIAADVHGQVYLEDALRCPIMEDVAIYGIQITAYLRDGGKQDKEPMASPSNCGGNCDDEVACRGWSVLPETKANNTKTCKHYSTVYSVQSKVGEGVKSGMKKGSCIYIEEGPCPTMTDVRLLGEEMLFDGDEGPTSINCAEGCVGECKGWSLKQGSELSYVCKHFGTITGSIVDKGFFSKKLQAPCSLHTDGTNQLDRCPIMEDVAIYGIQITAYLRDGGKQDKEPMASPSNCGGNCDDEVACRGWSVLPETKANNTKTCKHYVTVYSVQSKVGKGVKSGMKKGSCIYIEEGPCPTMTDVRLLGEEMLFDGDEGSTSIYCAEGCVGECKGWSLKQGSELSYVCKHFGTITGSIVDKGFFSKKLQAPCSLHTYGANQLANSHDLPGCFINNYYKGPLIEDIKLGRRPQWTFDVWTDCQSRCQLPKCTHVTFYKQGWKYRGFEEFGQKYGCKLYKFPLSYVGKQPPRQNFGNIWNQIAKWNYWSGPKYCDGSHADQKAYYYFGVYKKAWAPNWVKHD